MKIIVCTLALATSVCWGADLPSNPPVAESSDNATAPEAAEQGARRAVEEAGRIAERAVREADRIAQSARDQGVRSKDEAFRQVHRAMELAQSKVALAEVGEPGEPLSVQNVFDGGGFAFAGAGRTSTQPLIIRSSDLEAGTVANIQEDLTVMSRILTKTVEREVGREGHDSAMGIVISALPGSRRPQSIYLEGYGAIFLVNVKFPLVAPASKDEEKSEKVPDTTWEQTKRELYVTSDKSGTTRLWEAPAPAGAEYNADQVESLKKELLETLKNATNIREIKPEESVTIVVMGSRTTGAGTHVKRVTNRKGTTSKTEVYAVADGARAAVRESTMTLRARKSDIDAFAKGAMDFEQFKKHVSVSAY